MTEDPRLKGAEHRPVYTWPPPIGCKGCHWWKHWTNPFSSRWLWPGSLNGLICTVGGVGAVRFYETEALKPIRDPLIACEHYIPLQSATARAVCACGLVGLTLFVTSSIARRYILRWLLGYRTWMYEPPSQQSWTTYLWGCLVTVLSGWRPRLFSCSSSMPRLPVPPLETTIRRLLDSLEHIYEDRPEKFRHLQQEAQLFLTTVGPKLQRALKLRSWWVDNYVSDWWEKYVYLMSRAPLPIKSNYYICDQGYCTPTQRQCARAACFILHYIRVWESILSESLEPLMIRGTVPVCMEQYRRVLSTTRVPGKEMDTLVHYSPRESQHIIVNRRGILYRVEVTDTTGRLISPSVLEQQLEWVKQDADSKFDDVPGRLIPALTSVERAYWAEVRTQYFSSGVNKETLESVESALLYLYLDTESFDDLSQRAAHLLHGRAGQFWFDKSVQVIAMPDGHIGLNCEHSFADAPVVAHLLEYNFTYDLISKFFSSTVGYGLEGRLYLWFGSPWLRRTHSRESALTNMYDTFGHCLDAVPTTPAKHIRSKPTPLTWEVTSGLSLEVARACHQANKNIEDLDLVLYDHTHFGKGVIKKCKCSPDAFLQLALHLTFTKLRGKTTLTYEASMTRLFHKGRTETVRSLTKEAHNFVHAFLDPKVSRAEVRARLHTACEKHARNYKNCMNGKGIDRHLFALYVVSRGMGVDCNFLKEVLSIPWTLSTSQQPQQQIPWSPDGSDLRYQDMLSPGGGFGPVDADGYGVSYMVAGNNRIFFHVSSLKSAPLTDSARFMSTLTKTLSEMRELCEV